MLVSSPDLHASGTVQGWGLDYIIALASYHFFHQYRDHGILLEFFH